MNSNCEVIIKMAVFKEKEVTTNKGNGSTRNRS
jgi:hypothetical protein